MSPKLDTESSIPRETKERGKQEGLRNPVEYFPSIISYHDSGKTWNWQNIYSHIFLPFRELKHVDPKLSGFLY